MREQRQKVKREHDIRFLKVEEHSPMNGDIYEDQMDTNGKSTTFAIATIITTTTDTKKSTGYWVVNGEGGNTNSFSNF